MNAANPKHRHQASIATGSSTTRTAPVRVEFGYDRGSDSEVVRVFTHNSSTSMPASPAPTPVLRLVRTPASTFSLERSFERGQVVLLRSGRKPLERPLDVGFLVPFAAGNFIYIGASDLVPEVNKHHDVRSNVLHFVSFIVGIALLWGIRAALEP